jgi:CubicO group peptidase (beta-lactamase class C family)
MRPERHAARAIFGNLPQKLIFAIFCKSTLVRVTNFSGSGHRVLWIFKEHHVTKSAFLSIAIGILTFTDVCGRRTAAGADDESLRLRTDLLVQPSLDNSIVVGMTIGILRERKQEVFGYGRMGRDDSRVSDGDTIYELGSASKVFKGILLADAVVRSQVKLDQPAHELLPNGVKMPANRNRAITLQDLSTHVSGLPKISDNLKMKDPDNPYADYRLASRG